MVVVETIEGDFMFFPQHDLRGKDLPHFTPGGTFTAQRTATGWALVYEPKSDLSQDLLDAASSLVPTVSLARPLRIRRYPNNVA